MREGVDDLFHPPAANLPVLDFLRTSAIFLVFTMHYLGEFKASRAWLHFPLFRWGWSGVDLFFVLSGYLIGSQLWKELDRTGRIRIGHFLLRRGLRIWPLYFAFVALTVRGLFLGRGIFRFWSDAFFLSNVFPANVSGGWSLSTEEQFYVITPILLSLFALKLKPRQMWFFPFAGIAVVIAIRAWIIAHSTLSEPMLRQQLYFPIFTHADGLAVGLFLGWLSVFHKNVMRSKLLAAACAVAMLAAGLVLYRIKPLLLNFTSLGLIYGSMELYGISALPVLPVFRWRGFYLISRLSYGLYLNHFYVLAILYPLLSGWSGHSTFGLLACYCICLAVGILAAIVTFLLIEWPFLRIRARWVDRQKVAASSRVPVPKSLEAAS
jgi:peptidoglycan/LPS O-acetylase OafA/YrhL